MSARALKELVELAKQMQRDHGSVPPQLWAVIDHEFDDLSIPAQPERFDPQRLVGLPRRLVA